MNAHFGLFWNKYFFAGFLKIQEDAALGSYKQSGQSQFRSGLYISPNLKIVIFGKYSRDWRKALNLLAYAPDAVMFNSKVSPSKGLKGFFWRPTDCERFITINAMQNASRLCWSGSTAAASRAKVCSKISQVLCNMLMGSFRYTGIDIWVRSCPTKSLINVSRLTFGKGRFSWLICFVDRLSGLLMLFLLGLWFLLQMPQLGIFEKLHFRLRLLLLNCVVF